MLAATENEGKLIDYRQTLQVTVFFNLWPWRKKSSTFKSHDLRSALCLASRQEAAGLVLSKVKKKK